MPTLPALPEDLSNLPGGGIDVLSDILRVVRLSGASLFRGELHAPWAVATSGARRIAQALGLGERCVVPFHVVMDGTCRVAVGAKRTELGRGDVVILPHDDAHTLGAGTAPAIPIERVLPPPPWTGPLADVVHGDSGPRTVLFCGFLHCDAVGFKPLLAGLPRILVLHAFDPAASPWLRSTVELIIHEVEARRPGMRVMLERLNELVFVEALRAYMARADGPPRGLLAGLRDLRVARVLQRIHAEPMRRWSLPELAKHSGASRSVLSERFHKLVGQSPMDYLKVWRLHLACTLLQDGERTIAEIADHVGYESDAAFSKAFRKVFGAPPGSWRRAP